MKEREGGFRVRINSVINSTKSTPIMACQFEGRQTYLIDIEWINIKT